MAGKIREGRSPVSASAKKISEMPCTTKICRFLKNHNCFLLISGGAMLAGSALSIAVFVVKGTALGALLCSPFGMTMVAVASIGAIALVFGVITKNSCSYKTRSQQDLAEVAVEQVKEKEVGIADQRRALETERRAIADERRELAALTEMVMGRDEERLALEEGRQEVANGRRELEARMEIVVEKEGQLKALNDMAAQHQQMMVQMIAQVEEREGRVREWASQVAEQEKQVTETEQQRKAQQGHLYDRLRSQDALLRQIREEHSCVRVEEIDQGLRDRVTKVDSETSGRERGNALLNFDLRVELSNAESLKHIIQNNPGTPNQEEVSALNQSNAKIAAIRNCLRERGCNPDV